MRGIRALKGMDDRAEGTRRRAAHETRRDGDGGLQVLTAAGESLDRSNYEIQLLLGEDAHVPRFRGRVTRVWTRDAAGAGWISGFRFDDERSSAEDFIRACQASAAERRWVRCRLMPCG